MIKPLITSLIDSSTNSELQEAEKEWRKQPFIFYKKELFCLFLRKFFRIFTNTFYNVTNKKGDAENTNTSLLNKWLLIMIFVYYGRRSIWTE